jgi:LAO/AO transport system kinase
MQMMLHLRHLALAASNAGEKPWEVPLLRAVAVAGEGGAEIVDAMEAHRAWLEGEGEFVRRGELRARDQVMTILRDELQARAMELVGDALIERVAARDIDPHAAARQVAKALMEKTPE